MAKIEIPLSSSFSSPNGVGDTSDNEIRSKIEKFEKLFDKYGIVFHNDFGLHTYYNDERRCIASEWCMQYECTGLLNPMLHSFYKTMLCESDDDAVTCLLSTVDYYDVTEGDTVVGSAPYVMPIDEALKAYKHALLDIENLRPKTTYKVNLASGFEVPSIRPLSFLCNVSTESKHAQLLEDMFDLKDKVLYRDVEEPLKKSIESVVYSLLTLGLTKEQYISLLQRTDYLNTDVVTELRRAIAEATRGISYSPSLSGFLLVVLLKNYSEREVQQHRNEEFIKKIKNFLATKGIDTSANDWVDKVKSDYTLKPYTALLTTLNYK